MNTMYTKIAPSFDTLFLASLHEFMGGVENKMALIAKRDELIELRRESHDPDIKALLRRAIRHIDTELLARADLFRMERREHERLRAVS